MKKIKENIYCAVLLCAVLFLWGAGKEALAQEDKGVVIGGIEYYSFDEIGKTVYASIEDIRGDHLKTELYVPNRIKYQGKTYKVKYFSWTKWGWEEDYFYQDRYKNTINDLWKNDVVIPDKERSYHACLRKITIAKGVKVDGIAYGYDKLKRVILKDPANLKQAYYNNCPKLKKLYLPANMKADDIDIKNCPSLQVKIDKKNKKIKVIGRDIYSKNGKTLYNVVNGKKTYKVRKQVTLISRRAFIGNKTIERLYLSDKAKITGYGLGKMSNLKFVRVGKDVKRFDWKHLNYSGSLEVLDLPKSVCRIYDDIRETSTATVKKVYVRAESLKGGSFLDIPETTTFYVKNEKVKKQIRNNGFKGNIIVTKKMKSFSKMY